MRESWLNEFMLATLEIVKHCVKIKMTYQFYQRLFFFLANFRKYAGYYPQLHVGENRLVADGTAILHTLHHGWYEEPRLHAWDNVNMSPSLGRCLQDFVWIDKRGVRLVL